VHRLPSLSTDAGVIFHFIGVARNEISRNYRLPAARGIASLNPGKLGYFVFSTRTYAVLCAKDHLRDTPPSAV